MNQLGVPRAVALAVTVAGLAAMMWSLAVVLPDGGNAAIVGGGVAVVLIGWHAVTGRRRPDDPDTRARVLLGMRAVDVWAAPVLALVLAAACVVTAVVRHEGPAALPAVPLLLWSVLVALLLRRALRRAGQRLARQETA
jgi:hypothetical protein